MKRLVVIGAGPAGLEAALGAVERGFDVKVLEKDRVGSALRRWGATRFFSPFAMNVSERLRRALGAGQPPDNALLTGPEMADGVLRPLAAAPALAGRVLEGHRVVAVGRDRMTRRDLPGHPLRAERPFHLLVDTAAGEASFEADVILDASGVYDQPAAVGAGGVPARGERGAHAVLIRHLGTLERALPSLRGRTVLVVGHGHSAANALAMLEAAEPRPSVTWATRALGRRPCVEVADDPLPERRDVTAHANDLASDPPPFLTVERRASVEALAARPDGIEVTLSGDRRGRYDAVVGLTGYRPDLSFLSELCLDVSPVSEGPARLARALTGITDCLTPPRVAAEDLDSGEPGFYFVGAKAYGRLPTFLLHTGRGQLEAVLDHASARVA